jgi:gluconolactonase
MTRRSIVSVFVASLGAQTAPPALRKVRSGFVFTDGPVCDRKGNLYFSDVGEERIYCLSQNQLRVVRNSSNLSNGLGLDAQGRLIVCERGRLTRTDSDGRLTILADNFDGKGLHWPNDLVVCSDSSIYFTDLKQKNEWANPAKTGMNAVYHWSPRLGLTLFSSDCQSPNGVTLSPRQDRLYVSDTAAREIRVYDPIAKSGHSGKVLASTSIKGAPDGVKTDVSGNVWVCEEEGLVVFNPNGIRLAAIPVPETPSNYCFTADGATLFITARTSIYELKVPNFPNSGKAV